MMILLWLLVPVLAVVIVGSWLWYRERRPTSVHSSVEEFSRELSALSPKNQRRGADGSRPGT